MIDADPAQLTVKGLEIPIAAEGCRVEDQHRGNDPAPPELFQGFQPFCGQVGGDDHQAGIPVQGSAQAG